MSGGENIVTLKIKTLKNRVLIYTKQSIKHPYAANVYLNFLTPTQSFNRDFNASRGVKKRKKNARLDEETKRNSSDQTFYWQVEYLTDFEY